MESITIGIYMDLDGNEASTLGETWFTICLDRFTKFNNETWNNGGILLGDINAIFHSLTICDSKKVDFHQSKPTCDRRRPHVWPCAFGGNDGKRLFWTKSTHSRSNVGIHTQKHVCTYIYIDMHIHARIYLYI